MTGQVFQNMISLSYVIPHQYYIAVCNWSNWLISSRHCGYSWPGALIGVGSRNDEYESAHFQILWVKGIKNGFPCIVEIRGTQGCALAVVSALAYGLCRGVAKAQP